MTPDELSERLINFAARVGKAVDALPDTRMARHIAGQLVRSGTSPAPNYEEACAAESRADFVHKLAICLKELRESRMLDSPHHQDGAASRTKNRRVVRGVRPTLQHHCSVDRYREGKQGKEAIVSFRNFQFAIFNSQLLRQSVFV